MQRPRRTSEFIEEPSSSKRLSRKTRSNVVPSPAPGTAKKYASRQSRIAVPSRPSSVDRGVDRNAFLGVPSSAVRHRSASVSAAPTPQKTPLGKSPATRVLLNTAEKRIGPLHNDKHWVQDQVLRITDFLRNEIAQGTTIPGITQDFFSARSGGLRHMSIKQFVAIINYFLQFACASRFTVGTNHVEEIVNILQKLQYPHQVNKSWLKTPNTQHSFGHVMLLLDFFMDFMQSPDECEFPLQPEEYTVSQPESERIPDVEFQALLLSHSEKSFMLWGNRQDADYEALKAQTCDALIQKRCDIKGLEALAVVNKELEQQLASLEQQRPELRRQDEVQLDKLEKDLKYRRREIEMLRVDFETETQKLNQLKAKIHATNEQISSLKEEIDSIKSKISKQKCSVEQRDALIEEVNGHNHMLQILNRAFRDLQECSYREQVILSRTKTQLREQVEKYNGHIREIYLLHIDAGTSKITDELQIPLNATKVDLQRVMPIIMHLRKDTESQLQKTTASLKDLEKAFNHLEHEIESSIKPKIHPLKYELATAKSKLLAFEQCLAKERSDLAEKVAQREYCCQQVQANLQECECVFAEKQKQVLRMTDENEHTMSNAEKNYYDCAGAREAYLDKYAATLAQANTELQVMADIVENNEQLIKKYKNDS